MKTTLTERIVEDSGYRTLYSPQDDARDTPHLARKKVGERLHLRARVQRRTVTEAQLIRRMQERGVGRPSTYAAAIAALRRHRYVDDALNITPRGWDVLQWAQQHYPELSSPAFTARLESMLDALASGRASYRQVVGVVWERISRKESR